MPETSLPLALINVSVSPSVLAKAVRLIGSPLTRVLVSFLVALPRAVASFGSFFPLAVIGIAIHPGVLALALHSTEVVLAFVDVLIREDLEAHSVTLVLIPLAFVDPIGRIDNDSATFSHLVDDMASINRALEVLYSEVGRLLELFPLQKLWSVRLVVQVVGSFFFGELETGFALLLVHVDVESRAGLAHASSTLEVLLALRDLKVFVH